MKAVSTASGDIVGFGCLTYTPVGQNDSDGEGHIAAAPPPHINLELIRYVSAEVSRLEARVKGAPHFGKSTAVM